MMNNECTYSYWIFLLVKVITFPVITGYQARMMNDALMMLHPSGSLITFVDLATNILHMTMY